LKNKDPKQLGNKTRLLAKVLEKYKEEIKHLQQEKTRLEVLIREFEIDIEAYRKIRASTICTAG
jgi:prefoldin subunit 5